MSHDPIETTSTEEGKYSHYIQRTDQYGRPVNIPVIDVRDGLAERMLAKAIEKSQNRSRYITYTEYHVSRKSLKQI